jgi:hypothetical protein
MQSMSRKWGIFASSSRHRPLSCESGFFIPKLIERPLRMKLARRRTMQAWLDLGRRLDRGFSALDALGCSIEIARVGVAAGKRQENVGSFSELNESLLQGGNRFPVTAYFIQAQCQMD